MKILYTLPSINPIHGGYRIVLSHLDWLKKLGHEVALFIERGETKCIWYDITFPVTTDRNAYKNFDCIVIGSPHSIWIEDKIRPQQKCFLFMQMVEEKFRPKDRLWLSLCRKFYLSKFPIIHGSHWGERVVRSYGRKGKMHYVGNGVNFEHFPIEYPEKDGKTILLESPFSKNPAKDTDLLAYKVAAKLRDDGYKIIGYGATESPYTGIEYYVNPDLETLNNLYRRAAMLIKATKWDARALSPIEAMTKCTVTARAIIDGDDDLMNVVNCLRTGYYEDGIYNISKELLTNEPMRDRLAANCVEYVQKHCNWDTIINEINEILCSK